LVLNILANALLVIRFSSSKEKRWRRATSWSTLCWLGALIVEIINIALFGPHVHRTPDYEPTEGFWCAVVSLMDAGVICIALVLHYAFDFSFGTIDDDDETELRLQGRKFILSVTFFLLVIGFQAFAYSRLEGWLYSDSIYFSIQWRVPSLSPSHSAYRSLTSVVL
jgi:potassium channel subfamily K